MGGFLLKWALGPSRRFLSVCARAAIYTVCICSTVSIAGVSNKARGLSVSQVNPLGVNRVQALDPAFRPVSRPGW